MATRKKATLTDSVATVPQDGHQPAPPPAGGELLIQVPPIDVRQMSLRIVGDSPLICHAWSEKAKKAMLGRQRKVRLGRARLRWLGMAWQARHGWRRKVWLGSAGPALQAGMTER